MFIFLRSIHLFEFILHDFLRIPRHRSQPALQVHTALMLSRAVAWYLYFINTCWWFYRFIVVFNGLRITFWLIFKSFELICCVLLVWKKVLSILAFGDSIDLPTILFFLSRFYIIISGAMSWPVFRAIFLIDVIGMTWFKGAHVFRIVFFRVERIAYNSILFYLILNIPWIWKRFANRSIFILFMIGGSFGFAKRWRIQHRWVKRFWHRLGCWQLVLKWCLLQLCWRATVSSSWCFLFSCFKVRIFVFIQLYFVKWLLESLLRNLSTSRFLLATILFAILASAVLYFMIPRLLYKNIFIVIWILLWRHLMWNITCSVLEQVVLLALVMMKSFVYHPTWSYERGKNRFLRHQFNFCFQFTLFIVRNAAFNLLYLIDRFPLNLTKVILPMQDFAKSFVLACFYGCSNILTNS